MSHERHSGRGSEMKYQATGRGKKNDRNLEDNLDDLLVFGYSCKLYRDDEKAQMINEGGLLIPWMGNDSLMIDRYDGRGHLYDLDCINDKSIPEPLSPQLIAEEELCQEERYRDLNYEQEELLEEEVKRQAQAKKGNQLYSYNYTGESTGVDKVDGHSNLDKSNTNENREDAYEDFIAPPELEVPPNMETPKTAKMHTIIARTALFVSQNGLQLEIVLKAKQANNPQFEFLYFDKPLNDYYKHVLKMIKAGSYEYRPPESNVKDANNKSEDQQDQECDKGSSDGDSDYELHPALRPQKVELEDKNEVKNFDDNTGRQENSKEEVIGDRSQKPTPWSSNASTAIPASQNLNYLSNKTQSTSGSESQSATFGNKAKVPVAQYESNNVSSVVEAMQGIVPPPPDIQGVIDKMAQYVARNGDKFELVVRAKSDPRFNFLLPWNVHYRYYLYKKKLCLQQIAEAANVAAAAKIKANSTADTRELNEKNSSAPLVPYTEPVSFTIKSKDTKSLLPDSDQENMLDTEAVQSDGNKISSTVAEGSKSKPLGVAADESPTTGMHTTDNVKPDTTAFSLKFSTFTRYRNIVTVQKSPTPEISDSPERINDRKHNHKDLRKKNHSKSPSSDGKTENRKKPRYSSSDSDDEYKRAKRKISTEPLSTHTTDSKVELNKNTENSNEGVENDHSRTKIEKLPGAPPMESIQVAEDLLATLKATLSRR
ncbi:Splicing factor, suppressor of white-apricot-like protein [Trichoplax sp. H2]|nr:Splicing factor, suppressor of white-apricot-like protein [Trichoplax sp. H2]|eukprot:RDD37811.1 Splicing factor, suppressor of white-apricot-like protein [Trichoplax sp. H2]